MENSSNSESDITEKSSGRFYSVKRKKTKIYVYNNAITKKEFYE